MFYLSSTNPDSIKHTKKNNNKIDLRLYNDCCNFLNQTNLKKISIKEKYLLKYLLKTKA